MRSSAQFNMSARYKWLSDDERNHFLADIQNNLLQKISAGDPNYVDQAIALCQLNDLVLFRIFATVIWYKFDIAYLPVYLSYFNPLINQLPSGHWLTIDNLDALKRMHLLDDFSIDHFQKNTFYAHLEKIQTICAAVCSDNHDRFFFYSIPESHVQPIWINKLENMRQQKNLGNLQHTNPAMYADFIERYADTDHSLFSDLADENNELHKWVLGFRPFINAASFFAGRQPLNRHCDVVILKHLLIERSLGNTPLLLACKTGNTAAALALIEKHVEFGVTVNGSDNRYVMTALHFACFLRDEVVIKKLLLAGADIFARNRLGQTPLDLYRVEILFASGSSLDFDEFQFNRSLFSGAIFQDRSMLSIETRLDNNYPIAEFFADTDNNFIDTRNSIVMDDLMNHLDADSECSPVGRSNLTGLICLSDLLYHCDKLVMREMNVPLPEQYSQSGRYFFMTYAAYFSTVMQNRAKRVLIPALECALDGELLQQLQQNCLCVIVKYCVGPQRNYRYFISNSSNPVSTFMLNLFEMMKEFNSINKSNLTLVKRVALLWVLIDALYALMGSVSVSGQEDDYLTLKQLLVENNFISFEAVNPSIVSLYESLKALMPLAVETSIYHGFLQEITAP